MTLEAIIDWVTNKEPTLSGLVALLFILTVLFKPAVWIISWFKSAKLAKQQSLATPPKVELSFAPDTLNMSLDAYSEMQRREREAAKRELTKAHGEERQRLEEKIEELNRRLANPEEALAQQHARIVQLEEQLAKRGNEIGGDALAKAEAALKAGNFDEAKEIFAQIAARTAPDVKTNADAEYALGLIAEEQVRWRDAADHYAKAAKLNPKYHILDRAGGLLWRVGRYSEAIAINEEAIKLCGQEFGMDSKAMANAYTNLAHSFHAAGYLNRAMENYEKAHKLYGKLLGEKDRNIAGSLNNMASLLVDLGRANLAEKFYRIAIDMDRKARNDKSSDFATVLSNFGLLLLKMKKYVEAEKALRQAIEIFNETTVENHPYFASTLSILSQLLWETQRKGEALDLMTLSVDMQNATIGADHPNTKQSAASLAQMRTELTSKN